VVIALAALAAAVAAGIVYQLIGVARDARRFPAPGRLIPVAGHRLHAVCAGAGTPTVVFESAIAASSLSWAMVAPDVARFTSVCAYDRAGLGWSDAPTAPAALTRTLDDLDAVVTETAAPGRIVLVGHSFGAFVCLAYAARQPARVSGLVLVDPPTDWTGMQPRQRRMLRGARQLSRIGGVLARAGVVRACLSLLTGGAPEAPRQVVKVFGPQAARMLERLVGEVRKLPADVHPLVQAAWCRPKCFRAMVDHLRVFEEAAGSVVLRSPAADMPLVVISAGDQPPSVLAAHDALARSSSRGRRIVASSSGHWVQFDEPGLVVDAIRSVVADARR
jgi:pimeloyl-ACP methyl ester carboxylesterase